MKLTRIYSGDVDDLWLPDHLHRWDVHAVWERERYDSMSEHLDPADTLWVIGAEHGYMAALWARLVGNTVLVEPSPEFWPNIRMTWEHNHLRTPAATVQALVGEGASGPAAELWSGTWPPCANSDVECPAQAYRYLHNPKDATVIPTVTLDLLAAQIGVPDAVSIDIEGAEILALRGAQHLLAEDVQWWVSIHPDLIERDYQPYTADDVLTLMASHGYGAELLAVDHEHHYRFSR